MSDTAALLEQQPVYEIPADLNMTTGDRLRLIADIIERTPQKWNQDTYWPDEMDEQIGSVNDEADQIRVLAETGRGDCGSGLCVCGWGVYLTPPADVLALVDALQKGQGTYADFESVGAKLLGLDSGLASALFTEWYILGLESSNHMEFARGLRVIADLPEPRTYDQALAALEEAGFDPDDD